MSGSKNEECRIVLAGRLDITAVGSLRDAVLAAPGDVHLDAGAVISLTTPGLQVLMAARDHLAASGRALRIGPVSAGFRTCARTLGVPLDRLGASGGLA